MKVRKVLLKKHKEHDFFLFGSVPGGRVQYVVNFPPPLGQIRFWEQECLDFLSNGGVSSCSFSLLRHPAALYGVQLKAFSSTFLSVNCLLKYFLN